MDGEIRDRQRLEPEGPWPGSWGGPRDTPHRLPRLLPVSRLAPSLRHCSEPESESRFRIGNVAVFPTLVSGVHGVRAVQIWIGGVLNFYSEILERREFSCLSSTFVCMGRLLI